jgi:hypothetical protein
MCISHQLYLSCFSGRNDPILIHFHDIPVFVLRAIPIDEQQTDTNPVRKGEEDVGTMYISEVHCHNHKICGKYPFLCNLRLCELLSIPLSNTN